MHNNIHTSFNLHKILIKNLLQYCCSPKDTKYVEWMLCFYVRHSKNEIVE